MTTFDMSFPLVFWFSVRKQWTRSKTQLSLVGNWKERNREWHILHFQSRITFGRKTLKFRCHVLCGNLWHRYIYTYVYARLEKSRVFLQIPFLLSNHSTIILRSAILAVKISASNNALRPNNWKLEVINGNILSLTGIFSFFICLDVIPAKPNCPRNCRYSRDSIQIHLTGTIDIKK